MKLNEQSTKVKKDKLTSNFTSTEAKGEMINREKRYPSEDTGNDYLSNNYRVAN